MTKLELLVVVAIVVVVLALLLPPGVSDREPVRRQGCRNTLHTLGMALWSYHDAYGSFPPAYVPDENGRPAHSWRVLMLPFLGEQAIYDAYRFDEPWDGPNNSQLQQKFRWQLASVLSCQWDRRIENPSASYFAVVGPHAAWSGASGCKLSTDFPDGLQTTVLLVEVYDSGITWFEPRDLEIDKMCFGVNDPSNCGIRSMHRTNTYWTHAIKSRFAHVLYADAHVGELQESTPPRVVRALLTVDGKEEVTGP
jgi:hypothetical protein